jgi:hypothetical protein
MIGHEATKPMFPRRRLGLLLALLLLVAGGAMGVLVLLHGRTALAQYQVRRAQPEERAILLQDLFWSGSSWPKELLAPVMDDPSASLEIEASAQRTNDSVRVSVVIGNTSRREIGLVSPLLITDDTCITTINCELLRPGERLYLERLVRHDSLERLPSGERYLLFRVTCDNPRFFVGGMGLKLLDGIVLEKDASVETRRAFQTQGKRVVVVLDEGSAPVAK